MTRWMRKSRGFVAGALALAIVLGLQLIATSAIASQMQAGNLAFGAADGQLLCLSDHAQADGSGEPQLSHKTTCDICAFVAQPGVAPALLLAPLPVAFIRAAEAPLPRIQRKTSDRHEPRLTRGPPLDA